MRQNQSAHPRTQPMDRRHGPRRFSSDAVRTLFDKARNPQKTIEDMIKRTSSKKVELRLLCGMALEPVVCHPIDIANKKVSEWAKKGSKFAAGWKNK